MPKKVGIYHILQCFGWYDGLSSSLKSSTMVVCLLTRTLTLKLSGCSQRLKYGNHMHLGWGFSLVCIVLIAFCIIIKIFIIWAWFIFIPFLDFLRWLRGFSYPVNLGILAHFFCMLAETLYAYFFQKKIFFSSPKNHQGTQTKVV